MQFFFFPDVSSWLDVIQYAIGISADKERTSEFPDNVCVELGNISKKFENFKGPPVAPIAPVSIANSCKSRSYILLP